jgi:hypothetical protein
MYVFRHDHIAGDAKAVLPAGLFQRLLKQALGQGAGQQRLPTIAAEGDEVQVALAGTASIPKARRKHIPVR